MGHVDGVGDGVAVGHVEPPAVQRTIGVHASSTPGSDSIGRNGVTFQGCPVPRPETSTTGASHNGGRPPPRRRAFSASAEALPVRDVLRELLRRRGDDDRTVSCHTARDEVAGRSGSFSHIRPQPRDEVIRAEPPPIALAQWLHTRLL